MNEIWLVEYRLDPEGAWYLNPERGCFATEAVAEAHCVGAREKYPSTEYRARLYVPAAEAQP